MAREIGSSGEIHQVLAAGSGSSQTKLKVPQGPPSLGPQSWQVCLLEGCMWEQPKVRQEIPRAAQAVGRAD